jgi:SsrA-binding protein
MHKKVRGNALAENRRARFDYEIQENFEAGIELLGHEVASARRGQMELAGGYAIIRGGEAWLVNVRVAPYQPKNIRGEYEESRARRLLLHKEELKELTGKLKNKSFNLVPTRAYLKNGIIKIELGLGRPKKTRDKRETIKKRDIERDIQRKL